MNHIVEITDTDCAIRVFIPQVEDLLEVLAVCIATSDSSSDLADLLQVHLPFQGVTVVLFQSDQLCLLDCSGMLVMFVFDQVVFGALSINSGASFPLEMCIVLEQCIRVPHKNPFPQLLLFQLGESRVAHLRVRSDLLLDGFVELLCLLNGMLGSGHTCDTLLHDCSEVFILRTGQLI